MWTKVCTAKVCNLQTSPLIRINLINCTFNLIYDKYTYINTYIRIYIYIYIDMMYQLGPQQLKNMTVLRDSSACLRQSSLIEELPEYSVDPEKRLTCFEQEEEEEEEGDEAESLRAFMLETWSLISCNALFPAWYITLLAYLKLITSHTK